jgi:hypothetical protein
MHRFRPRLTYANVVSSLCLFLLVGGGTFAIASSNTKVIKKVVNGLAPALSVNHANSTDSATNANHANSADSATDASHATNSDQLGGSGEAAYVKAPVTADKFGALPAGRLASSGGPCDSNANSGHEYAWQSTSTDFLMGGVTTSQSGCALGLSPENLIAPVGGTYVVTATFAWTSNATGDRRIRIVKNGSTDLAVNEIQAVSDPGKAAQQTASGIARLSAGDSVTLLALQDSGSALGPQAGTSLAIAWVGP